MTIKSMGECSLFGMVALVSVRFFCLSFYDWVEVMSSIVSGEDYTKNGNETTSDQESNKIVIFYNHNRDFFVHFQLTIYEIQIELYASMKKGGAE